MEVELRLGEIGTLSLLGVPWQSSPVTFLTPTAPNLRGRFRRSRSADFPLQSSRTTFWATFVGCTRSMVRSQRSRKVASASSSCSARNTTSKYSPTQRVFTPDFLRSAARGGQRNGG